MATDSGGVMGADSEDLEVGSWGGVITGLGSVVG